MSTALHLAKPEDLPKLTTLVMAFHQEMGFDTTEAQIETALMPLLEGSPYGVVYLMGPARAPIGYAVLTFSWSVEFGGMDALIDEIFVRPAVRGRGIASEVMVSLRKMLAQSDVKALHLEVNKDDESAIRLYTRARFERRDRYMLMSQRL